MARKSMHAAVEQPTRTAELAASLKSHVPPCLELVHSGEGKPVGECPFAHFEKSLIDASSPEQVKSIIDEVLDSDGYYQFIGDLPKAVDRLSTKELAEAQSIPDTLVQNVFPRTDIDHKMITAARMLRCFRSEIAPVARRYFQKTVEALRDSQYPGSLEKLAQIESHPFDDLEDRKVPSIIRRTCLRSHRGELALFGLYLLGSTAANAFAVPLLVEYWYDGEKAAGRLISALISGGPAAPLEKLLTDEPPIDWPSERRMLNEAFEVEAKLLTQAKLSDSSIYPVPDGE